MKTFCNFPVRKIPLLILSLAMGCSKAPATDARLDPPLVIVSKVVSSASDHPVYTGVVTARVEGNIGFRVSGKVIERLVDIGQEVRKGQVVMRLAKNGSREAEVYLPESVRPATNSEATAMIYSEQSKKYKVRLRELSKATDPVSRTFTARYVIPDSSSIPLGSTVSIELNEAGETLLQVPLASIYNDGRTAGIWIVNPNNSSVSLRKVSVKQVSSEFAFVEGEVRLDEQIVALGAHLLHEGELVKIADNNKAVLK